MTTPKMRLSLWAAGVAASVLMLAGCSPKTDDATTTTPAAPAGATIPATPTAGTTAIPAATPTAGTTAIPAATPPPGAGASRPDMAGPGPGMAPGGAPSNYGGAPKSK